MLRIPDACCGYLCLHREAPQEFSPAEVLFVRRLAPHLAEGLRTGPLRQACDRSDGPSPPDRRPGDSTAAQDGAERGRWTGSVTSAFGAVDEVENPGLGGTSEAGRRRW